MKLRIIAEKISREPVREAANSMGDLIQYMVSTYDKRSEEIKSLYSFLSKPSPRSWERAKWIVDSAIKSAQRDKPRAEKWAFLKSVTSPTIASAVYDIDPKFTRDTPLANISQSKPMRDKVKKALGPEGYVSSLSNIGTEVPDNNIRKILKTTAQGSKGLQKAVKTDIPRVRLTDKF